MDEGILSSLDKTLPSAIWAKMAKYVIKGVTNNIWPYSTIDATSLFNKVLLHEVCRSRADLVAQHVLMDLQFTHAHSSSTRKTIDVGGWDGYGKQVYHALFETPLLIHSRLEKVHDHSCPPSY
jgi:hypothetical protein